MENTVGKGKRMLVIVILATFNLSSANAFNLVMSKILFGKGLNVPKMNVIVYTCQSRKPWRKKQNAVYQHFLPFYKSFQKSVFSVLL